MNKELEVELVFDFVGGCELRASANDDHVVYARFYGMDGLVQLAVDISLLPDHPAEADFSDWEYNDLENLGYDEGICREDEAIDVELGYRKIWNLHEFLKDRGDFKVLLSSLLWHVAAVELAAAPAEAEMDALMDKIRDGAANPVSC